MKKEEKDYIEARLMSGQSAIQEVWSMTEDWTPEDAICEGILRSIKALFRILDRVKTED